jgi:hypothetical protein
MYKKFGVLGLFLMLVIILMINPLLIYNIYDNILGRVILIIIIIFFTIHNVTLGLLAVLCLIIASNMYFIEGLENMGDENLNKSSTDVTIGDDNANTTPLSDKKIRVITRSTKVLPPMNNSKISEMKTFAEEGGVDRQTIEESVRSKSSKALPTSESSTNSDDVQPSESTKTEGFSSLY